MSGADSAAATEHEVQARPELPGTDQEFESFIYLVSHDVRNSVRALMEIPQWIEEDMHDAGMRPSGSLANSLTLMNTHARRLDRMLFDLLVYSRIGRMQVAREIDIDAALDTVLSQIRLPRGFEVRRDLALPRLTLGDRDVLTLLTALIENAIRHHGCDSGTVTVSTRRDGAEAVLSVSDDGQGIPEAYRERVFEAMKTLRPRDEVEGSGMGLAHVRKIARIAGGSARIITPPNGSGTQLELRLPFSTMH